MCVVGRHGGAGVSVGVGMIKGNSGLSEEMREALQILYESVKDRKMKEFINLIKDGGKYGEHQRVQT